MGILWSIVVGFIVGLIAKAITPGRYKPSGFILTTVLGIVGALVGTWLGQAIHLYEPGESTGFIGSVLGAIVVLLAWSQISAARQH